MQYARAVLSYTHKSPDKVAYFLDMGQGLSEPKDTPSVTAVLQVLADEGYRVISTSECAVMEPRFATHDIRYTLNVFLAKG